MGGAVAFVDDERKLDRSHERLLSEGREQITMPADVEIDFGISRIYQSYRETVPGANRDVRVFRTAAEATAWLEKK